MRMKNKLRAAAGLVLALTATAVAGCGTTTPPPPAVARGMALREPLVNPRPYGAADAALGLDVLGAWCRTDPQANLLLSPSSLASGLGMAYLGAQNGTAQAMASVLHLPATGGQALEAGLQARSAALRRLDGPGVTVDTSDQVWADPSVTTLPGYLNAVATGYDAGVAQAPLLSHADQAAQEINQAIATATHGQIPRLLQPDMLQAIGWVLTDALYLKADWATPFPGSQTGPGAFTTASGRHVTASFMNGGSYASVSMDGWTAVWLPYRGGQLAMMALLPPSGQTGCTLPTAAQLGTLTTTLATGGTAVVDREVGLPKVTLQNKLSLNDLLTKLGMGVAFTRAADFTGLSPQAERLGFVEQAATLQVGEKGTVASAATAVGAVASAREAGPAPVTFDRPYLMVVTAAATGEPLIMARVTNPPAQ
jgi:serpin B